MTECDVVDLRRLERHEADLLVYTERGVVVYHSVFDLVHVERQVESLVGRLSDFVQRVHGEFGHDRFGLIDNYELIFVLVGQLHVELIE